MLTMARLREVTEAFTEEKCALCGTTNGIHRTLRREDGTTTICRGGDLGLLARHAMATLDPVHATLRVASSGEADSTAIRAIAQAMLSALPLGRWNDAYGPAVDALAETADAMDREGDRAGAVVIDLGEALARSTERARRANDLSTAIVNDSDMCHACMRSYSVRMAEIEKDPTAEFRRRCECADCRDHGLPVLRRSTWMNRARLELGRLARALSTKEAEASGALDHLLEIAKKLGVAPENGAVDGKAVLGALDEVLVRASRAEVALDVLAKEPHILCADPAQKLTEAARGNADVARENAHDAIDVLRNVRDVVCDLLAEVSRLDGAKRPKLRKLIERATVTCQEAYGLTVRLADMHMDRASYRRLKEQCMAVHAKEPT